MRGRGGFRSTEAGKGTGASTTARVAAPAEGDGLSSLGTDGGGTAYNTVSGDAVILGPVLMAQHIEGLRLPERAPDVPPSQGPPPSRVFVNRVQELAGLRDAAVALAGEPGPGMLHVVGVGGVGKTQLVAQSVSRELEQLFPDGRLYVDLEDLRRDGVVDLVAVLGGFLRALGVGKEFVPAGVAECGALFRSLAAGKSLLVVVDNVQHAPEARTLLPPRGLLVAIGRRALPSLLMDGAVLIGVDPLDEAAGTELVRRWHADADYGTAAEVVRLCAGHPLALRAAVEWLAARPHLTLDDVVRDLTAAGRHGTGGVDMEGAHTVVGEGEEPQRGEAGVGEAVDTVLDSVLAEVSEHTRRIYDLLGTLPGTTTTTDLLRAAGAVGWTRRSANCSPRASRSWWSRRTAPGGSACTMWRAPTPGCAHVPRPEASGGRSCGASWTSTGTRPPTPTPWCSATVSGSSRHRAAPSPNSRRNNRCSRDGLGRWTGWTRSASTWST